MYKLQNTFQNTFGVSIDQIVNSPEAKTIAIKEWRYQLQFRQIESSWKERDAKKYEDWLEQLHWSTYRYFKKFGDKFPVIQWMTKWNIVSDLRKGFRRI